VQGRRLTFAVESMAPFLDVGERGRRGYEGVSLDSHNARRKTIGLITVQKIRKILTSSVGLSSFVRQAAVDLAGGEGPADPRWSGRISIIRKSEKGKEWRIKRRKSPPKPASASVSAEGFFRKENWSKKWEIR